ncbi:hypothetical protein KPL78_13885 [Roseomonas sp. HJA6]|uniref:Methyl-accepting chemotaxis protein n=1 Tax=Roseomonas alba TaxID=2846776 RepID=A0ABS7A9H1_9PROT|nr:hypothetical protein [Neoroseomonas alba]MBW6398950.1 hypothetical protein [Neoroseomonas alba]
MHLIAPIIASSWVVWSVVGLLVAWAVLSAARLVSGTRAVSKALAEARQRLESVSDAPGFTRTYESLSAELAKIPLVGGRWREFRDSLLIPKDQDQVGVVRATSRAGDWFDVGSLLRAVGVDTRYHAAMPNLLVGAGLLFTFLGLAAALGTAGGIVAGEPAQEIARRTVVEAPVQETASRPLPVNSVQTERNRALKNLLDTASFKFITSLVGLFLSISYALLRKDSLKRTDSELDRFLEAVEVRVPLVTPAALQAEANRILSKQHEQLQSFNTDLAINIGTALDRAFDQRLGEHVGPLAQAVQQLAAGMSSRNEDAIQTMLDAFLERLQGGTGDRMQQVADTLSSLGSRLEGVQSSLGDAAVRMAQAADSMATRMGEGAERALGRITDQMTGVVEALRATAEQTRAVGTDAGEKLSARIEAAASTFEVAARQVAETLSAAANDMQRRMGEESQASNARLAEQFAAMLGELRSLAEASRTAGSSAFEALAERIAAAALGFEATAANVAAILEKAGEASGGALGRGAEDAVQRIAEATEGMRNELRAMLEELRTSVGAAGEVVREQATAGGEVLRVSLGEAGTALAAALAEAAKGVTDAGTASAAALREGGEAAGAHLQSAGSAVAARMEGMGAQARLLGEAAERIAARIADLESVVTASSAPFAVGAADLKAAGAAARDAVQPLRAVAEGLRAAMEQIAGAVARLEGTQTTSGRLMEGLTQAAARFEGVDKELARTLDELQKGLKGFTGQVAAFVTQTDSNLAKATSHLGAAVKQLEETLGDFLDQMKKR